MKAIRLIIAGPIFLTGCLVFWLGWLLVSLAGLICPEYTENVWRRVFDRRLQRVREALASARAEQGIDKAHEGC